MEFGGGLERRVCSLAMETEKVVIFVSEIASFGRNFAASISSASQTKAASTQENTSQILNSRSSSDVPAAPINAAVGGKASLQPKRTPVTEREIEAILVRKTYFTTLEFTVHSFHIGENNLGH
ncbi:hypothetical protein JRO89_XS11G0220100 [Xanthoceras sorbifolium]|uniref:Uncharacterized protein n=1 Tax=Xanthoceras sorbifolium TaxID=99658 RepID=A0ABQ8HGM0_9ROSI|nr:hypothetical protein JRO89_XS11G0220100 [Xanthoceras sorbifolium]